LMKKKKKMMRTKTSLATERHLYLKRKRNSYRKRNNKSNRLLRDSLGRVRSIRSTLLTISCYY
jgi:hypothetical protein